MKLSPNKTFPHPVLWNNADDYKNRQFQATREFSISDKGEPVLAFNFSLNEEKILKLIKKNKAAYVIEIYCPTTSSRRIFQTAKKADEIKLPKGELYRQVEVNAFVICTKNIKGYSSNQFHDEFGKSKFDMFPGDVLAADDTQVLHWDTENMKPITSVFELVENDSIKPGMFEVDISNDKVKIMMRSDDKIKFNNMRQSSEQKPVAMFLYFSVVVEVLKQMKPEEDLMSKRWYQTIERQIDNLGEGDLDSWSNNLFKLAQKLLHKPLRLALTNTK